MDKKAKYFFCGIGGIGMSGLAKIMAENGYTVFGSDLVKSSITESLEKIGVNVFIGHKKENLKSADIFVFSFAVPKSNPEFKEAKKTKLKMISRSELLNELMRQKKGIAVSGTHGKTTTSTMLSLVLEDAGLDPTIAVGGEVGNIGGNAKTGKGLYFVAEACEYEKSFLDLHPYGAIITNIEMDHLDTYQDLNDITEAFRNFVLQMDPKGFLVLCAENKETLQLKNNYSGRVVTYGFSDADYVAKNITVGNKKTTFFLEKRGKKVTSFELIIPGSHNVLNALSVIAASDILDVDLNSVKKTLSCFTNAKRRYEIKGEKDGVLVIDDYAHHPTEIMATLTGVKDFYPNRKIWAVFQPHQHSRTRFLLDDFAKSFKDVHRVIVPDIYEARDTEEDKILVTSEKLVKKINKHSKNAIYIGGFKKVADYLKKNAKSGDLILTIGAGPVYRIGEDYLGLR